MFDVAYFIGKQWVKTFKNEDGTETKSYKYQFKLKTDSQFATNYWGYDSTKGADQLQEGNLYSIGFTTQQNRTYTDKTMRLAKWFGTPAADAKPKITELNKKPEQPKAVPAAEHKAQVKLPAVEPKIPDSLKGEWLTKLKVNSIGFLSAFASPDGRMPDNFRAWIENPEMCETDIIFNAIQMGTSIEAIHTMEDRLYAGIMAEMDNEVI
jgi:hypothetical protein